MITPSQSAEPVGRLMPCAIGQLKPHPAFIKLGLSCDARKLSALADQGESAFADPIVVSQKFEIVVGFELWHLATLRQRAEVLCLQFAMSEEESLQRLIRSHQRSVGFNDFIRILLALELEPWLKLQGKMNQTYGGRLKGSSSLTEAQLIDVRAQVAKLAVVSTGNVTNVKQILATGIPEIIDALKRREITIHRATRWVGLETAEQRRTYNDFQLDRDANMLSSALLAKHPRKRKAILSGIARLRELLRSVRSDPQASEFLPQTEQLLIDLANHRTAGTEGQVC